MLIVISLTFMVEMDFFHHHADDISHADCPLCLLNSTVSALAIFAASSILFKPLLNSGTVIVAGNVNLLQDYSSYYHPDRAPPRA